jgi:hypothetical protein
MSDTHSRIAEDLKPHADSVQPCQVNCTAIQKYGVMGGGGGDAYQ